MWILIRLFSIGSLLIGERLRRLWYIPVVILEVEPAGKPFADDLLAHSLINRYPDYRIALLNSIHHEGATVRATS